MGLVIDGNAVNGLAKAGQSFIPVPSGNAPDSEPYSRIYSHMQNVGKKVNIPQNTNLYCRPEVNSSDGKMYFQFAGQTNAASALIIGYVDQGHITGQSAESDSGFYVLAYVLQDGNYPWEICFVEAVDIENYILANSGGN